MAKAPLILISLCITCCSIINAQDLDSTSYDFWVGKWKVSWDEPGGKKGGGTNTIEKTLDNKVIQENFRITDGANQGFKGTSLSVFDPRQKVWHQAWADNQGGYYDFYGSRVGDKYMFSTILQERGEKKIVERMVFYDIQEDAFTWDWELSEDGGETWLLSWRIQYTRKE